MTPAQIQAEQARRQAEEEAQAQEGAHAQTGPDPTAHFSSTAGGGSASSSSAGPGFYSAPPRKAPPQASPPKKARPKEPNVPPDWIIQKPPDGYVYNESKNPDYRGTPFTTSLWMNEKSQFLLSILQGPVAASPNVSGWAQYLRRTATYGCMVFGVCNPRVVTDEDSAKISEIDWLRLYSHLAREIFKNGRGKQFAVYRECIYDNRSKKRVLAYRLMKDCGNVAYKDFLEQIAAPT
eukprot:s811_g1.t1